MKKQQIEIILDRIATIPDEKWYKKDGWDCTNINGVEIALRIFTWSMGDNYQLEIDGHMVCDEEDGFWSKSVLGKKIENICYRLSLFKNRDKVLGDNIKRIIG